MQTRLSHVLPAQLHSNCPSYTLMQPASSQDVHLGLATAIPMPNFHKLPHPHPLTVSPPPPHTHTLSHTLPQVPPRLLMGPGPTNSHPRILAAQSLPLLGHMHPPFIAIMDEIKKGLQYL